MIGLPLLAVAVSVLPIDSTTFKTAFDTYYQAISHNDKKQIMDTSGPPSFLADLAQPLTVSLPGFDTCSASNELKNTASAYWTISCDLGYRNASLGALGFDEIVQGLEKVLLSEYPGYHELIFMPATFGDAKPALRVVVLRRGPIEPYLKVQLSDDIFGTSVEVAFYPGRTWPLPMFDSLPVILTGDEAATLSDGYCEIDFRDGAYVVQSTPQFWKADFPPLLREFLVAHERAHLELNHLALRTAPGFTDDQRQEQEIEADDAAFIKLAHIYGASFPAMATRLLADAKQRFQTATDGHPAPLARLTEMTRDTAESLALSVPVDDSSPVDLVATEHRMTPAGPVDALTYENFGRTPTVCEIDVLLMPKEEVEQWRSVLGLIARGSALKEFHLTFAPGSRQTIVVSIPQRPRKTVALPPSLFDHTGILQCNAPSAQ